MFPNTFTLKAEASVPEIVRKKFSPQRIHFKWVIDNHATCVFRCSTYEEAVTAMQVLRTGVYIQASPTVDHRLAYPRGFIMSGFMTKNKYFNLHFRTRKSKTAMEPMSHRIRVKSWAQMTVLAVNIFKIWRIVESDSGQRRSYVTWDKCVDTVHVNRQFRMNDSIKRTQVLNIREFCIMVQFK